MAEFQFYATKEESLQMLRDLFARGDLRIIVGRQCPAQPSAKIYTTFTEELAREVGDAYKAHLFGSFSTHPPLFTKITTGPEAGRYTLGDTGGGPQVLFRPAALYENRVLTRGTLWTQPHYQLTQDALAWATPEVKAAHADMVKRMKPHLLRWEGIWITPGALLLLKEGQAELPGALKRLGALARAAKTLPKLGPAIPVTSQKRTRRPAAARTARAE